MGRVQYHFSTADQAARRTCGPALPGQDDLLPPRPSTEGERGRCAWEYAGRAVSAHLYGPLPLSAVSRSRAAALWRGCRRRHDLPASWTGRHAHDPAAPSSFLRRAQRPSSIRKRRMQLTIRRRLSHGAGGHGQRPIETRACGWNAMGLWRQSRGASAAGYDKQCEVPDKLLAPGFGFVELGGGDAAPPQAGKPGPPASSVEADERGDHKRFGAQQDDGLSTLPRSACAARKAAAGPGTGRGLRGGRAISEPRRRGRRIAMRSIRRPWWSAASQAGARTDVPDDQTYSSPNTAGPAAILQVARPSRRSSWPAPSRRATRRRRVSGRAHAARFAYKIASGPGARRARRSWAATALESAGSDGLIVSNTTNFSLPRPLRETALAREGPAGSPDARSSTSRPASGAARLRIGGPPAV